jgi:predicted nucleic acid-binding protein
MSDCCVDASIAVKWAVKGDPFREKARAFLHNAGANGIRLIAPPIRIAKCEFRI